MLGGRWDEYRRTRVIATSADPVLFIADLPAVRLQAGADKQASVSFEQCLDWDVVLCAHCLKRPCHRLNVAEHFVGGSIVGLLTQRNGRLSTQQPATPDLKTLNS